MAAKFSRSHPPRCTGPNSAIGRSTNAKSGDWQENLLTYELITRPSKSGQEPSGITS